MGIDSCNIARKQCNVDGCDCPEFILDCLTNKCSYCGDFAPKHARSASTIVRPPSLEVSNINTNPMSSTLESSTLESFESDDVSEYRVSSIPDIIPDLSGIEDETAVSSLLSDVDFGIDEQELAITKVVTKKKVDIRWKAPEYGYIENATRPTGKFYNALLPKFWESFWPWRDDKKLFKIGFIMERKRQWEVKEEMSKIESSLKYLKESRNEACFAKFENSAYIFKKTDKVTLEGIKGEVGGVEIRVTKLIKELKQFKEDLYTKGTKRLRSGYTEHHRFTEESLAKALKIKAEISAFDLKIAATMKNLPMSDMNTAASKKRKEYLNKKKSERRKKKRNIQLSEKHLKELYRSLSGFPYIDGDHSSVGTPQIDVLDEDWQDYVISTHDQDALLTLMKVGLIVGAAKEEVIAAWGTLSM